MFTYFISDLHLDENCFSTKNLFIKFLKEKAVYADALYILGDFWEKWLGDDHRSKYITEIINLLKEVSSKTKVYFLPGNRDFLLGKIFQKETNCIILPDPYIFSLYDKKIMISHGDIFCINDKKDQIFRKFVQSSAVKFIFQFLPLKIRELIANFLRKNSRSKRKNTMTAKFDVNLNNIKNLMDKHNIQTLIHGHTHIPSIQYFTTNEKNKVKKISLGSWGEFAYILKYDSSHSFKLEMLTP